MIVTLAGGNSFGLQSELQQLIDGFVAQHGELALERLDGQEAGFERISEALTSLPFLSSRKMIVLRAPGSNKQFTEVAEQILSAVPETTDVIIVEPKLDKRLAYYKFLKKSTDFRHYPELDERSLTSWLTVAAKHGGGSLSSTDAHYLVDRVGPTQQLLSNELEKLLLYDPKIIRRTIDLLTEPAPQSTVFQLLEAAFSGKPDRALKLYSDQRAQKVEPQQIVAMLAWQLHVIAIIKTAGNRSVDQIAQDSHISPFVILKSHSIARSLTLAQLKKLVNQLLTIDLKTKSTAIDPDEALQHYLLAIGASHPTAP